MQVWIFRAGFPVAMGCDGGDADFEMVGYGSAARAVAQCPLSPRRRVPVPGDGQTQQEHVDVGMAIERSVRAHFLQDGVSDDHAPPPFVAASRAQHVGKNGRYSSSIPGVENR